MHLYHQTVRDAATAPNLIQTAQATARRAGQALSLTVQMAEAAQASAAALRQPSMKASAAADRDREERMRNVSFAPGMPPAPGR